jgi:uncharacterized protein (TIGR02117 family)
MKKFFIYLKRTVWILFTFIAGYFLIAVILSLISTKTQKLDCVKTEQIFISSSGIHLDIVIPVKNLKKNFIDNLQVQDNTKYISFGWGDKEFYINTPTWSDLTFSTAFKALFLKSETAMHVIFHKTSYVQWKKIDLCKMQLENLNSFIKSTFKKSKEQKFIRIGVSGYSENDYFFEARGSFSFYRTCNIWVNEALKKANIKTSIWSPFVYGILYHIEE